jgi:glycosyltransferase involved in cell wall biosynthesis
MHLLAWKILVKPGGILAGHDYWHWGEHEGVGRAVDELFPSVVSSGSVWRQTLGGDRDIRDELVSVIVPSYRQAAFLNDAVTSIRLQTYKEIQLILVCGDKESEDEANRIAERFKTEEIYVTLRILYGAAWGRADALNQGIEWATGTYVLCLDADDVLEPTAIEKLIAATPRGEEFTITTCDLQKFGDSSDALTLGPYFPKNMLEGCYLLTSSLFTRALWKAIGGFKPVMFGYEDWEFWISAQAWTPFVSKVNERLFRYRIHGENGSNFCRRNDGVLRSMIRLLHPECYGPETDADMLTVARCPEEVLEKFLERASWFPENPHVQRFARLMHPAIRNALVQRNR